MIWNPLPLFAASLVLSTAAFAAGAGSGGQSPPPAGNWIMLYLEDGSVVSGNLEVSHIQVDTIFGLLTVPIDKIKSFTPGLNSRPTYSNKIMDLIEALADYDASRRDQAQQQLTDLGPDVRDILSEYQNDNDVERKLRIAAILLEFEELIEDNRDTDAAKVEPIRRSDTVVTTAFTIIGDIQPQTFTLVSRYGKLSAKLSDIISARRTTQRQARVLHKRFTVEGNNVVPRQFVHTGILLKRGQHVAIKAEGSISLTPWGNRATSDPNGNQQYGWHIANELPNGALVAKIAGGTIFMVGAKHRVTVKRSGMLQLGIATHPTHVGQNFPGQYEVKITVSKPKYE